MNTHLRNVLAVLVFAAAVFMGTGAAMADKLFLKDGRVLEGKIIRDEGGVLVIQIGDAQEIIPQEDISRIVRDDASTPPPATKPAEPAKPQPATETKPANAQPGTEAKPADPAPAPGAPTGGKKSRAPGRDDKVLTGRPTRVAVLNFGAPRAWQGEIEDMVGREVNAAAWEKVVPMLEKDGIDVVVVRINSGGGYSFERGKFEDVYEKLYKPRFRVVAWVESAISCAAMSPWCIEEYYMLPEGNIGGCTSWSGNLVATKGFALEQILYEMERSSKLAKRDPKIMRSMQVMDPLSCNIDEATGEVTWFQDLSGQNIVNRPGNILTLTANDAVRYKFAKGIAATKDELAKVMGLTEYVFAGKEASDYIDRNMRDCDRVTKRLSEVDHMYKSAVDAAKALRGPDPKIKQMRFTEIAKARQFLNQMRTWMSANPNFFLIYDRPPEWFDEQLQMLKELSQG